MYYHKLQQENPQYLEKLISYSRYSKEEIEAAAQMVQDFNADREKFLQEIAYPKLTFENGDNMGGFEGYPTEKHRKLNEMLSSFADEMAHESYNSHLNNPFPVRKWGKDVKKAQRVMKRIQKYIDSNSEFTQTYP